MIDTYFDRCDAASGYKPTRSAPISEDPRYWGGSLYNTVIDRYVAESKYVCRMALDIDCGTHRREIRLHISMGESRSQFWPTGQRK